MASIRRRIIEQISEGADEHDRFAQKYSGRINSLIVSPNEKESFQK
jgi:hypothetical protein